jgi:PTH2 family peptidyl-tRNA hydrolase
VNAKQVIVIRRDLGMRRGKEIAQGAHASIAWLTQRLGHPESMPPEFHVAWLSEAQRAWVAASFTKICCQVSSQQELEAVMDRALAAGVEAHLITDAGRTEFGGVPTVTAVAVGPDWEDRVDAVTGELRLY